MLVGSALRLFSSAAGRVVDRFREGKSEEVLGLSRSMVTSMTGL